MATPLPSIPRKSGLTTYRSHSMTSRLGEIDCPTLVIVGEQDAISTPDEMREIARAMPRARFVEIAGSGHMSPMEKPSEVSVAMLEFLGGV